MSAADLRESVARAMCRVDMDEPGEMHVTHYRPMADAALRAIADAGPSEKMVEAACRAYVLGQGWNPDEQIVKGNRQGGPTQPLWMAAKENIRSALSAALKEMG